MHASMHRSVISLVRVWAIFLACLSLVAQEPVGWQAEAAEKEGDIARAWMLYSQASALDPSNQKYLAKTIELRTPALNLSKVAMIPRDVDLAPLDPALVRPITPEELAEINRMQPPPELKLPIHRQSFQSRGPVRKVIEEVLKACQIRIVFDSGFDLTKEIRIGLDDASCPEAIHAMEMVSGTFIVPLSPDMVLVARDTREMRSQQERTVTVTIPIPEPVAVQEVQEMARGIQQLFEIQKIAIDGTRSMVMMRDRYSKIQPARMLLRQMLLYRPQVVLDVEFLQIATQSDSTLGFDLPTLANIINLGGMFNTPSQASGRYWTFGGGQSLFGIGVTDSTAFASMTHSKGTVLHKATLRSLDGQAAELHVGDRFPIVVQSFTGSLPAQPGGYVVPPTIQFENLGLTLKITTHVHGSHEVSMDIDSEFKVLTSQSLNGIPVISNRKFQGQVRLKNGEWAVAAGMAASTFSNGFSGIPGLSQIPAIGTVFRKNTIVRASSDLLIVLKPKIIYPAPESRASQALWVGSETKPLPPI